MSRKAILTSALALVACLCSVQASAQRRTRARTTPPAERRDTPQEASQQEASQVPTESADVAITATVTARELHFEVVPNPTVEFPGKPRRDTVWEAERENLPRPVQPGVTYRNIGIRLKIVSRFADIERIVAEALGEVPLTDEVKPQENATPQPGQPPPVLTPRPNGGSPR